MSCRSWRASMPAALSGRGDRRVWRRLRAHLVSCAGCSAAYDRAVEGLALLEGGPAPEAVRCHLERDLMEALPRRRWVWAGGLAAAAALLLAVGVPSEPAPRLQARGRPSDPLGVRVLCIEPGPAPRVRDSASSLASHQARCALTDDLQLAYSLAEPPGPRHLAIYSLGPGARRVLYWPRPDQPAAPPTAAPDVRLPGVYRASYAHQAGDWRIFVVLTSEPLSADALQAAPQVPLPGSAGPARMLLEREEAP